VNISWSLSAIGCYEKCQLKAKFKYVDKIKEARSESASRGVGYHSDIENYLTGGVDHLPEGLSYYESWLKEVKKYEIYPEKKISLYRDWNPSPWDGPGVYLKAVLDLLVVRRSQLLEGSPEGAAEANTRNEQTPATELIIYDWKTGKIYPDHDDQKSLYSVAAFAEFPSVLSVRAIHVYIDLRQLREKTFHRDQMHELRNTWDGRAAKFLEAVRNPEGMIPNPGFHCRWCGYSAAKGGPCRF
jgi:hypothetical protein